MLLTIVSAIVSSLVKHVTNCVLDNFSTVKIQGAPSWYMKRVDGEICVYDYEKGDFSAIDRAKRKAKIKMIKKIDGLIDVVIYENAPRFNTQKEIALMKKFKKDDNLNLFVDKNMKFEKIEYYKDEKEVFVRGCIPAKEVLSYEERRLKEIRKKVLNVKVTTAFDELDGKSSEGPFKELDEMK